MPSAPANGGRNGPRPRRPDSARSRLPSVLRDSSRRRIADTPLIRSILSRQPTIPRRLTNKITIYGWSTSTTMKCEYQVELATWKEPALYRRLLRHTLEDIHGLCARGPD